MVSVIVPVYNTAKWLPQCITSIVKQDYKNLDIILVNDASTDRSRAICKKYADRDSRITVIDKEKNEGLEAARRSGVKIAKGKYIMHIDSDDRLTHRSVISKMYEKAEETQADYVETGIQRIFGRFGWIKRSGTISDSILIEQPELFDKYYISFFGCNILSVNMWGKLYRKEVLDRADIQPEKIFMGEDLAYNMKLFPRLNRIFILNDIGYDYRIGGITSGYNPHFLPDSKHLFYLKQDYIRKYGYCKADKWTRFELKNVLKTAICQQIAYTKADKNTIVRFIVQEINDPIYENLYQIDPSEKFWGTPFVEAFRQKDAEKMYEICRQETAAGRFKRIGKKIGYRLANII